MSGAEIIPMKSIFSPAVQSTLTAYFPAAENPYMQGRVSCETSTFPYCMQMISGSRDPFIQALFTRKMSLPQRMLYCHLDASSHH